MVKTDLRTTFGGVIPTTRCIDLLDRLCATLGSKARRADPQIPSRAERQRPMSWPGVVPSPVKPRGWHRIGREPDESAGGVSKPTNVPGAHLLGREHSAIREQSNSVGAVHGQ